MSDSSDPVEDVGDRAGLRGFDPAFVDVDGTRTRYYDVGEGEPLVLIHGGSWAGTSSANTWSTVLNHLGGAFRVLAFDRVGCGLTDNPDSVDAYRFRTELDHALAFVDAVGLERCHLGGASWGAGLAARMAVEDPERFDTLIMTNSHTFGPPAGDRAHRADRLFERAGPGHDPTDPEYTRFRYTQFSYRTEHITDEFCRAAASMRARPKARETAEVMATREEEFYASRAAGIEEAHRRIKDGALTMPTLYVFGRNDTTVPLGTARAAFDLIGQTNPNVRLHVYNECGHVPARDRPAEFSQDVIDFIRRWQ